ncbi:hypothetical protein CSUI_009304 [Cystoisospora suis]|uniref:Uncharacterized protein n=1 Tax=Cystoisospora suis TaxID=483139 RepID=A0A2C6K4A7_9APIC|nr:hypothetical protein CSUI_009304 [Cystoisospora suis]
MCSGEASLSFFCVADDVFRPHQFSSMPTARRSPQRALEAVGGRDAPFLLLRAVQRYLSVFVGVRDNWRVKREKGEESETAKRRWEAVCNETKKSFVDSS